MERVVMKWMWFFRGTSICSSGYNCVGLGLQAVSMRCALLVQVGTLPALCNLENCKEHRKALLLEKIMMPEYTHLFLIPKSARISGNLIKHHFNMFKNYFSDVTAFKIQQLQFPFASKACTVGPGLLSWPGFICHMENSSNKIPQNSLK